MKFNRRTVTSRSGMSQEEALLGLQSHPKFKEGSVVAGIRRRGERWVISLFEPKPEGEGESEEKDFDMDMDMPKSHEEHEDKPKGLDLGSDGPDDEDKEKSDTDSLKTEIKDLKEMMHKIVDALGISEPVEHKAPGMVEDKMPTPPTSPMQAPKPGNNKKEVVLNKSMRPGEAPPGTVNVGSPAFASTNRIASFTASSPDTFGTIKEAKDSLEREFGPHGYSVKQIRREDGQINALLAVR